MLSQIHYWSMDETACNFRKMLTLEQYKTTEAGTLYEKVLTDGPLTYIEDIFREMIIHGKLIKYSHTAGSFVLCAVLFVTKHGRQNWT